MLEPFPDDLDPAELAADVRAELRSLPAPAREPVARHLAMVRRLVEDDPAGALAHAREAVRRAGRVGVVRETAGIAAYRCGEYAEALRELRAAIRMGAAEGLWPVLADCERGLGRPRRALEMAAAPEAGDLDEAGRVELRIVAAGARADLGDLQAAVLTLQCPQLRDGASPWSARLRYAYADALGAVGRDEEALTWFRRAAAVDPESETGAADRVAELEGIVFTDLGDDEEPDDGGPPAQAGEDAGGPVPPAGAPG